MPGTSSNHSNKKDQLCSLREEKIFNYRDSETKDEVHRDKIILTI